MRELEKLDSEITHYRLYLALSCICVADRQSKPVRHTSRTQVQLAACHSSVPIANATHQHATHTIPTRVTNKTGRQRQHNTAHAQIAKINERCERSAHEPSKQQSMDDQQASSATKTTAHEIPYEMSVNKHTLGAQMRPAPQPYNTHSHCTSEQPTQAAVIVETSRSEEMRDEKRHQERVAGEGKEDYA